MNTNFLRFLFVFLLVSLLPVIAGAQGVPKLIQYQGNLADDKGDFINGQRTLMFGIFSAATGGTAIWTETHAAVQINKGLFSVMLGSLTPLTEEVFKEAERYLEVSVDSKPLAPRQKIAAVAYALVAQSVPTGSVTGAHIKDGSIGGADIANDAIEGKHIKDASIKMADIAAGTITTDLIKDGSIQGEDIANRTINVTKIKPRYDSDWKADKHSPDHPTPFVHNLNLNLKTDPVMFDVYFSFDNPPSKIYPVTWKWGKEAGNPVSIEITANSIVLNISASQVLHGVWTPAGWDQRNTGFWRVIIW